MAEMKARLAEIKERIWELNMADRLFGSELAEYNRLCTERTQLIIAIRNA